MNSAIVIGILLMLPLTFGALFQARPKKWVFDHASIAMLEIAVFAIGLGFLVTGVLK